MNECCCAVITYIQNNGLPASNIYVFTDRGYSDCYKTNDMCYLESNYNIKNTYYFFFRNQNEFEDSIKLNISQDEYYPTLESLTMYDIAYLNYILNDEILVSGFTIGSLYTDIYGSHYIFLGYNRNYKELWISIKDWNNHTTFGNKGIPILPESAKPIIIFKQINNFSPAFSIKNNRAFLSEKET